MTEYQHIPLTGGCTCGGVRYRLNARPLFVHCCHCTWCQRESGSAFALNALIEATQVELLHGTPTRTALPSPSGQGQVFTRCADCGITLWTNYAGPGDAVHFVRVGTLDEPTKAPPDIHIFTSTKQPWVVLGGDVPVVDEYYRRADYWPTDSIARYEKTRAG